MSSARRLATTLVVIALLSCAGAGAASASTLDVCASGCAYGTVQAAVTAAGPGDTVAIAAGSYAGNVTIDTPNLRLVGAGASSTTLTAASGTRIVVGDGADGLTVEGLTVVASGAIAFQANFDTDDVTVRDVVIDGATSGFDFNAPNTVSADRWTLDGVTIRHAGVGVRFATRAVVIDMEIDGGRFEDNGSAINGATSTSGLGVVDGFHMYGTVVVVPGATSNKGLYFEALRNAVIEDVDVSGTALPGYPYNSGIEVNEKYAAYANITLRRVNVHGAFTDQPAANAQGISIKARNDAPSYNTVPASLTNVRILDSTVSGNQIGVAVGNDVRDVAIHRSRIVGNSGLGLLDFRDAGTGSLDASDNWWGCNAGPVVHPGVLSTLPGPAGGCDAVGTEQPANGDVLSPRLQLTATAAAGTIAAGGQAVAVDAGLTRNSAGATVTPAPAFPAPPTLTFTTSLGTLGTLSAPLVDGGASTVLTSGSDGGTATVTAALDGASASVDVAVVPAAVEPPPAPPAEPEVTVPEPPAPEAPPVVDPPAPPAIVAPPKPSAKQLEQIADAAADLAGTADVVVTKAFDLGDGVVVTVAKSSTQTAIAVQGSTVVFAPGALTGATARSLFFFSAPTVDQTITLNQLLEFANGSARRSVGSGASTAAAKKRVRVTLPKQTIRLKKGQTKPSKISLPAAARAELRQGRAVTLSVTVHVKDALGNASTGTRTYTIKAAKGKAAKAKPKATGKRRPAFAG